MTHPEYYTGFRREVAAFWPSILRAQGKPQKTIRVYRALPAEFVTLNPGDWVTPSLRYAQLHSSSALADEASHILVVDVPACTLRWPGDDLVEWGYYGPEMLVQMPTKRRR